MNKKILIGSIIAVAILVLVSSSSAVIAFTSEETSFASSESSAVLGCLPIWEEEIHYYNPDTLTHMIGLCWGTPPYYWYSAIRLTEDELSPYTDWDLTKVNVALSCDNGQLEVWAKLTIWGEGTENYPGNKIYEDDTLFFVDTGYHLIELDTPIAIDEHNEIWIGIEWEQTEDGAYIPYNDEGPVVPFKSDWVSSDNGASWSELREYGLPYNWAMGAIVEGEGTELSIINVAGPIGVNAEVKNIGKVPAYNVEYTMIVTGGILGRIFRIVSDSVTELAPDETIPIYSDLIFGLGPITIDITANASHTYEVSTTGTGFIFGPFVFIIKFI